MESTSMAPHAPMAPRKASTGVGPRLLPPNSGWASMVKKLPLGGRASNENPPAQLTVTMASFWRKGGAGSGINGNVERVAGEHSSIPVTFGKDVSSNVR